MKVDRDGIIIKVIKLNKTFMCLTVPGNHRVYGVPEWAYRKAEKGKYKLESKKNKNNIIEWHRIKEDK